MPAQGDTDLIEFHGWTLRVRRALSRPARLLLLLHGWTGDENSMWVFVRNFAADYWIVAPRAPHPAQPIGYSWRPRPSGRGEPPELEDFRPAASRLIELAEIYTAENGLAAVPLDLIGFSQGAALSNAIAFLYPRALGRVGVLAGFVPSGAQAAPADRPLAGTSFFVAHGTLDEMVRVEFARQSVELLERAGAAVTFCEDEVGHRLSAGCLRALETFFA
jgi:phospholipase/carboxylesterase